MQEAVVIQQMNSLIERVVTDAIFKLEEARARVQVLGLSPNPHLQECALSIREFINLAIFELQSCGRSL